MLINSTYDTENIGHPKFGGNKIQLLAGDFNKGHHTPTKEGKLQRCLHRLWTDGHWSSSPSKIKPATHRWSLSGTYIPCSFHHLICISLNIAQFISFPFTLSFSWCSIFSTKCSEDWSTCIQQTSCTGTSDRATCCWMPSVNSRLGILAWQGPPLRLTSWWNMLLLGGTGRRSSCSTARSTLQQLIYGQWAASSVRLLWGSHYFLEKIMFISWG